MLLKVLGDPGLYATGESPDPLLGPGKPLALLAYLAVAGPTRREELVTLLWGEQSDARARNAFRQTLHRLKGVAGPALVADPAGSTLSLARGDALKVDLDEFAAAAHSGRDTDAATLYGGEFLAGFVSGEREFDEWVDEQRRRIRLTYGRVAERAAQNALDAGDPATALAHARRLIAVDPANAAACRLEVEVLIAAGRQHEAVLVAERHADAIARGLDDSAAAPLRDLAQRLRGAPADNTARWRGRGDPTLLPFVGRDAEIARLTALWRSVGDESGAVAVVTGEAGIGKSRLLAEHVRRTRTIGPMAVASGRERGEGEIPYAGFADALRAMVRKPAVAGASRHLLSEAARLLPELRDRFELSEPKPLEDDAALIRFFEGIAAYVEAVAYEEPLYFQIEDFHLASRRSYQLATYLIDRLAGTRVMFAFAMRTENGHGARARYANEFVRFVRTRADAGAAAAVIELRHLEHEALTALAAAAGVVAPEARADLAHASRGNPARLLSFVRGETPPPRATPVPLRVVLGGRLGSLSQHEQRLFVAAAIYARPVPIRVLAAAAHLPEPAALDAVRALVAAGMLVEEGSGVAASTPDAIAIATDAIGTAGIALLSGWAADALAQTPDATAAEMVRLYAAAGRGREAGRHARMAALDAAATGDLDAAHTILVRTLTLTIDERDRTELEKIARALGRAARRLPGQRTPPTGPSPIDHAKLEEVATAEARVSRTDRARPWIAAAVAVATATIVVAAVISKQRSPGARGTFLSDTLIVADAGGGRSAKTYAITGNVLSRPRLAAIAQSAVTAGVVAPPWVNPRRSPNGALQVLERVEVGATSLHLVNVRGDTTLLVGGGGEWIAADWSPDSEWILAIHAGTETGGEHAHLFAISVHSREHVAVDVGDRLVTDARWSPAGDRIAWTARVGATRQQDVFVSDLRGETRNVSDAAAEDYRLAWSPDGTVLAFTTERHGDPEIYSAVLEPRFRLVRVTNDPASDDSPMFSPDGLLLAFESTRDGRVGTWLVPALGGAAAPVTPADGAFGLVGWRSGAPPRYVDRIEMSGPDVISRGDPFSFSARVFDQRGRPFPTRYVEWVLPAELVRREQTAEDLDANRVVLSATAVGRYRLVAHVGGWRRVERDVVVSAPPVSAIAGGFDRGLEPTWRALGRQPPRIVRGGTGGAIALYGDRLRASGVLSADALRLEPGLSLEARVRAPYGRPGVPRSFTIALADDEPQLPTDSVAPQPFRMAHITWVGDADRFVYGAGREATSEATASAGASAETRLRVSVDRDGHVSFFVNGTRRWRSRAALVERSTPRRRVRLWIGSVNAAGSVVVGGVAASTTPAR